jgi:hypothetical protein
MSTYCADLSCPRLATQRVTTRVDGASYSRRYDDWYCTKHAAEAVAELGGGGISLVVSIVALPSIEPARVNEPTPVVHLDRIITWARHYGIPTDKARRFVADLLGEGDRPDRWGHRTPSV